MQNQTDLDIFVDMMESEHIVHEDIIEKDKKPEYYITKAQHIIKQIDNSDNYYYFLKEFIKNFKTLNNDQQKIIKEEMGIFEKEIPKTNDIKNDIKRDIKTIKKTKPKLNMGVDDY